MTQAILQALVLVPTEPQASSKGEWILPEDSMSLTLAPTTRVQGFSPALAFVAFGGRMSRLQECSGGVK